MDDLVGALREALDRGYQGFSFRVKGEPFVMPNDSVRVDGAPWGTIQVDLSPREGDSTEVEMVEPLSLEVRATHEWPPVLDPPQFWEEPFAALAEEVELPVGSLTDAVHEGRAFIEAIEAADSAE